MINTPHFRSKKKLVADQVGVAQKFVELFRGDELVPVVSSGRHEVQDVLGGNDGSEPRPRRPVDGCDEERPT